MPWGGLLSLKRLANRASNKASGLRAANRVSRVKEASRLNRARVGNKAKADREDARARAVKTANAETRETLRTGSNRPPVAAA